MDRALSGFLNLGYQKVSDIIFDEYRGINICFVEKDGYLVELVSPVNKDSVVNSLIKKLGNTPYHICYKCEDIDAIAAILKDKGYVQWENAHEAVAFFVNAYVGMVELLEMK